MNFTATASDDLALPAGAYTWDLDGNNTFGDGGFTGATASTTFATAGAKTVRVRVTDSGGSATTVAKTVNVNTVPVADFTVNPQTPRLNETVTFTSTSTDADAGQTLALAWDLDADGQFDDSTAANPTRAFPTEGEKVVRLRVTDSVGCHAHQGAPLRRPVGGARGRIHVVAGGSAARPDGDLHVHRNSVAGVGY